MRRQPLGDLILVRGFHALPDADGRARIVAAPRHHHQADVVRLALLDPGRGPRDSEIEEVRPEEPAQTVCEPRIVEDKEDDLERAHHVRGAAHLLGLVPREVVCDLVAQDSRQPVLRSGDR